MLTSLHIENIALIRRLDLEPEAGFCAFTGETGAGKSILIDSIGLLCGARGSATRELIRTGEDSALVEGMFLPPEEALEALRALDAEPDEDGALFLQRRLTADGRSNAKINGRAVPLSRLREVAACLLTIHGQQDTQTLAGEEKQRRLLDAFAGNEDALTAYRAEYAACRELKKECEALEKLERDLAEKQELLAYQSGELRQAKLRRGEEAELLTEHALLANSEKVTENACLAYESLYAGDRSAASLVKEAKQALGRLCSILPGDEELSSLRTRLDDALAELVDIAETLRPYASDREQDAGRLTAVENRLEFLSALQRKYRTDENGLLEKLETVTRDLAALENSGEDRKTLENALKEREKTLREKADALHAAREEAAGILASRVKEALAELDMPGVRFEIRVKEGELTPDGGDEISFLVSANAGEEARPIGKIASGGELSRIMLCLQTVLADAERIPTLLFDEIDTGISGKTNEKIGRMLSQLASGGKRQIFCVTHAAQLAARASRQYRISKCEQDGRTQTDVTLLDRDRRIDELARIMGGVNVTDTVRRAAEELLDAP